MVNKPRPTPLPAPPPTELRARVDGHSFTLAWCNSIPRAFHHRGGSTVSEYDSPPFGLAKAMTGWTYGETPVSRHRTTCRTTSHPWWRPDFSRHHSEEHQPADSFVISSGGTRRATSRRARLYCRQSNLPPFVSYRLIQRFAMKRPFAALLGRVASASVFAGNLQT